MNQNVLDRGFYRSKYTGKTAIEHILVHETNILLRSETLWQRAQLYPVTLNNSTCIDC